MVDDPKEHWQGVYESRAPSEVSWHQPVPERSLRLIQTTGLPPRAALLDIGGGASTLVDHLLAAGFTDVTVLDIAPAAGPHFVNAFSIAWRVANCRFGDRRPHQESGGK